jgi:hypothetical protein
VPDHSEVRCFLADLLSSAYSNEFSGPGGSPTKSGATAFHRIWNSQYTPGRDSGHERVNTPKGPTVVCSDKFFDTGITVVLWYPHLTPLFRSEYVFVDWPYGMLAVASAKVGIIMEDTPKDPVTDTTRYFPNRLIVGIDEARRNSDESSAGTFSVDYMKTNFLNKKTGRHKQILNGYHTSWGARLIPVNRSNSSGGGWSTDYLKDLIPNGPYYVWDGSGCVSSGSPPETKYQDSWDGAIVH